MTRAPQQPYGRHALIEHPDERPRMQRSDDPTDRIAVRAVAATAAAETDSERSPLPASAKWSIVRLLAALAACAAVLGFAAVLALVTVLTSR